MTTRNSQLSPFFSGPRTALLALIACVAVLGLAACSKDGSDPMGPAGPPGPGDYIDQGATFTFQGRSSISYYAPFGETFIPSSATLDFVDVKLLLDANASSGTVKARIRQGSPTGSILGTSNSVTLNSSANPVESRLRFTTSLTLTPGQTYFLELVNTGGNVLADDGGDKYSKGTLVRKSTAVPTEDLWFRTGYTIE